MITFDVTLSPDSPSARLREIRNELNNRREIMSQVKMYMIKRWSENFATNGGIYGEWAGNSAWKEGGGKTLIGATGALIGYFNSANYAGRVTQGSVEWSFSNSEDQYSVTHSESGIKPNPLAGHMPIPIRPIWGLNRTDHTKIVRMIDVWVQEKVVF